MASDRFYSPLRYPGGKAKLAPFIKSVFFENELIGTEYIEPYAGGAGLALTLLFEEYVSKITINDWDRSIYAFWYCVLNHNSRFCDRILSTPIDVKTRKEQRDVQRRKKTCSLFDLGFSTFYLNRTNISGVILGGAIGGNNQDGNYNINARFNKNSLIERITRIGDFKKRIRVTHENALNVIKNNSSKDTFIYLDPPYVRRGKDLYMNYYKQDDHRLVSDAILSDSNKFLWVLSYDKSDLIQKLYSGCRKKFTWKVGYGSSNRCSVEDIFLHPNIKYKKSLESIRIVT